MAIAIVRRWHLAIGQLWRNRMMGARTGAIQILYRTPFQRIMREHGQRRALAALYGIPLRQNLPYGLDMWAPQKVLNMQWSDESHVEVVSFRPEEWEAELIAAAQPRARRPRSKAGRRHHSRFAE